MVCPSCGARNDDAAEVCFTCRAVLAVLTRGSVVAERYEILALLGRGGMGTVYKVQDRVLHGTLALKVLRPEIARLGEMADRFKQEIRLARKVKHRNVCRIHEYGVDQDTSFIAMEWIEGTSLKEALRARGGFPAHECFDVALQVAEGLRAIHAAGVVHRDLTTPNIMLGAEGVARILDFGIAKHAHPDGAAPPTAAGYVIGSPEYMSPEQAQGRPVDYRTDIYSFGVVLFEIATGAVPFRGENPVATLLLHVDAPPPLENPAIPPALVPVLRTALAKDPRARYPTADALIGALRSAAAEANGTAAPRTDTARIGRRVPGLGTIALGLGLTLGLAFLTLRANRAPTVPPDRAKDAARSQARPNAIPAHPQTPPSVSSPPTADPSQVARRPAPTSSPIAGRSRVSPVGERRAEASPPSAPQVAEPARGETRSSPIPEPPVSSPSPAQDPVVRSPDAPASIAPGSLLVLVTPWADVAIDGAPAGQTPLARIPLSAGPHTVVLTHPDYQPFPRRVVIRPGETLRLTVALAVEGVRKRR